MKNKGKKEQKKFNANKDFNKKKKKKTQIKPPHTQRKQPCITVLTHTTFTSATRKLFVIITHYYYIYKEQKPRNTLYLD